MYNNPLATMTDINVIQRQLDTDSLYRRERESDIDSLGRKGQELNRESEDEGELDDLSMGSLHSYQDWETNWDEPEYQRPHLEEKMFLIRAALEEEEEISEEDAEKIERWTRIHEDGYEIINGVKYSAGGSIIYSDYEREEEEQVQEETASEIAAKTHGELLRFEARKRIEANPQAYEGLPRYKDSDDDEEEDVSEEVPYFDWEAEDAVERWNAQMEKEREIIVKERDIYLANGGLTNEEFAYLHRRIDAHF